MSRLSIKRKWIKICKIKSGKILPDEYKEEVKKYYSILKDQYADNKKLHFDNAAAKVQERVVTLDYFFGIDNIKNS